MGVLPTLQRPAVEIRPRRAIQQKPKEMERFSGLLNSLPWSGGAVVTGFKFAQAPQILGDRT